jgi:hypothetical protein
MLTECIWTALLYYFEKVGIDRHVHFVLCNLQQILYVSIVFFYIYDRNRRAPILYSVQNVTVSDKVRVRRGQAVRQSTGSQRTMSARPQYSCLQLLQSLQSCYDRANNMVRHHRLYAKTQKEAPSYCIDDERAV